ADREGVHQDVALVAEIEHHLAAHRRDADAVTVMSDAAHHAAHQERRPRMVDPAEAQRVENGDRPRAHREDVAQDAADTRRRSLERLDERGMVVTLDLEHPVEALAELTASGVLSRSLEDLGSTGGQRAEQPPRALVGAVLGPHDAEHADLLERGGAAEQVDDARVLVLREALVDGQLRRDRATRRTTRVVTHW